MPYFSPVFRNTRCTADRDGYGRSGNRLRATVESVGLDRLLPSRHRHSDELYGCHLAELSMGTSRPEGQGG
ncbi:hypothetical protein C8035_v012062 [Colletotrichum spinosum]|uniref:Uncharacterized protein n=1 Tax=Colletotrichum spinosum TaxID=1347390 RepID=A0A4R8PWU3_9PEZI|nr:hypothetical protein C8035_v012062 [Colletotrichum spinosum]